MKIQPAIVLAVTTYALASQSICAATFVFQTASPTFFEGQWGITDYWAIQGGTGPDDGTANIPDGLDTVILDRNPNPINATKLVLDGGGTPQPLTVAGITATGAAGIDVQIKTYDLIVDDLQVLPSAQPLDIDNERDRDLIINGVLSGSGDLVLSRAGGFSDGVTSDEVIRLGGSSPNTFSGNLSMRNTSNGAQPSFWVADKVGAFGQASSLLLEVNGTGGGTNIAQLVLTANTIGGEGAIDDDATSVILGLNAEFNVAAGVDEVIGSGLLTVEGVGVVPDGTYDSTESWIIGNGTVTVRSIETEATLSGNILVVTDVNGGTSDDRLRIAFSGGIYTISDDGGLAIDAATIAGSSGSGTSSVMIPQGAIDRLEVYTLAGSDSVIITGVQPAFEGGVAIDGGTDNDTISIDGSVDTGVAGTLVLRAETINQAAALVSRGETTLDATGGSIILDQGTNDFAIVNATGQNITLVEQNSIDLQEITAGGDFSVTAGGDIGDVDGAAKIVVTGHANFAATGNLILDREEQHNFFGGVTISADRVPEFASRGDVTIDSLVTTNTGNFGNRIQSGAGIVTLAGSFITPGNSDLQVRLRGGVVQLPGSTIVTDQMTVTSIGSDVDASLAGNNDARLFVVNRGAGVQLGDIVFNDINALDLGGILANELTVAAGGDIRTAGVLELRGLSSITANGDLTFQNTIGLADTLTVAATGSTTISPGVNLTLSSESIAAPAGSTYTLLDNTGLSPVAGTFNTLMEGSPVAVGADYFEISYLGGDGNDITLLAPQSSYWSYILAQYPGEADLGIIGIEADPNGDGVSNGLSFITGTSAVNASPEANGITEVVGDTFKVTFTRVDEAAPLQPSVEGSLDLNQWDPVNSIDPVITVSTTPVTGGSEITIEVDTVDLPKFFCRQSYLAIP